MKRFIFDAVSRRCIGYVEGSSDGYNGDGVLVDAESIPLEVPTTDMACLYLAADGATVTYDTTAYLSQAKTARIARIKAEAARLIEAQDWRLARARERQDAGWGSLAETDVVMAQREAIRRSSDLAEAVVEAMTDPAAVQAYTWSVEVVVDPQRRLSHKEFSDLFTASEMQAILAAAEASAAVRTWWERFKLARATNLDDPATQAGVEALEIAGLIGAGRAAEILAPA